MAKRNASGIFFRHSRDGRICKLRHPSECRESGSWTIKVVVDGRTRWKGGYKTWTEARDARAAAVADTKASRYVEPNKLTLGAWLDEWAAGLDLRVKPTTAASYRWLLTKYVTDGLRARRLHVLDASHLETLYAEMRARGLSDRTTRYVHAVLRRSLGDAVKRRKLARNPAADVEFGKVERKAVEVWTPEQTAAFLDHVRADRLEALFVLAVFSGLRRGELLGLNWADVDLAAGTLLVRRSLVVVHGKPTLQERTKTGKPRRVALGAETMAALRDHAGRQAEDIARWGDAYRHGDLVFAHEIGAPIDPTAISKTFRRMVAEAALPPLPFHSLRHLSASLALAGGVPLKVVSERLGHSRIGITADLYTHLMPGADEAAAGAIESAVTRSLQTSCRPAPDAQQAG